MVDFPRPRPSWPETWPDVKSSIISPDLESGTIAKSRLRIVRDSADKASKLLSHPSLIHALNRKMRLESVPDKKSSKKKGGCVSTVLRRVSGFSGGKLLWQTGSFIERLWGRLCSLRSFPEQFYEAAGCFVVWRRSSLTGELWIGFQIVWQGRTFQGTEPFLLLC